VQNSITLSMELLQVIFSTKNGIVVLAKPPALLGYELGNAGRATAILTAPVS
jgi:hypothetical protein